MFAMVAAGELPCVRIGRAVRIPREALERWVREQTIELVERNDAVIPMDVRLRLERASETPSRKPLTDSSRPFMIPGPGSLTRRKQNDGETR